MPESLSLLPQAPSPPPQKQLWRMMACVPFQTLRVPGISCVCVSLDCVCQATSFLFK